MNEATRQKVKTLTVDLQRKAYEFLHMADAYLQSMPQWKDYICEVCEGRRTLEYQAGRWSQGRTWIKMTGTWIVADEKSLVTHTMDSKHLRGEAFDFCLAKGNAYFWPEDKQLWIDLGHIGESLGLKSGAFWEHPDRDHLEIA